MKFTPIFGGTRSPHTEKPLLFSASTKVLPCWENLEPAQTVRERVTIGTSELGQQLRHYQWRNRTEFPIVRVTACHVQTFSGDQVELEIVRESLPILLDQLYDLPLFRVIYLLKETLIGCERLLARFGPFRLTPRMIGLNHSHRCRVWINENLASNLFQALGTNEQSFLYHLSSIFQEKTLRGKAMGSFYADLFKCNSCANALAFIDHYTKENKIAIPSLFKCDKQPESKKNMEKFNPTLSMTRSPRFVHHLRDTLTPKKPSKEEVRVAEQKKVKEECKQMTSLLALKKSAETRADIYGSGTMTFTDSKSREDLAQPCHFLSSQEITYYPPMQKSELLQFKSKELRPHRPSHKVTNRQLFSCFTPQPQVRSPPYQHWDMGSFLSPPQQKFQEVKQGLQDEVQSLFQRNNWEQRIEGLFGEQQDLKRSVHAGEPQWRPCEQKLHLLQNYGKSVMESALQGER